MRRLAQQIVMGTYAALVAASATIPSPTLAQSASPRSIETTGVPNLTALASLEGSELRSVLERFSTDRSALGRRWDVQYSPTRRERFRAFYHEWQSALGAMEYATLSLEGKIDYVLLANEIRYALESLDREETLYEEMGQLIPFAGTLMELQEARRRLEIPDPAATAGILADLPERITEAQRAVEAKLEEDDAPSAIVAYRTANALRGLQRTVQDWHAYYAGYDPLFTWWTSAPWKRMNDALGEYIEFLRERVLGIEPGEPEPIVGDPIGADGLRRDLRHEMIPYTPDELIAIAQREFEWLDEQMLQASRDLGYGDDWRAALEYVKGLHAEPGRQTEIVRDLAHEAVTFLEVRDLVTIPPLAKEIWRMEMLSPERQLVSPFFLGGEVIRVSFPTDEMEHADKLMSMRGNNIHFSRATVHHELIPGHHLQGFMTRRYNSHRSIFRTPFWGEGWALYWEMQLWDLGFPQTAEDRVGMLFWRMHRAARIIFSLSFHLGRMTPQEAIDFLVERVGHERANATAEVRRSFAGSYSPLYQAGYMLGGMQIRALHEEFVGSGRMTDRAFHDMILQGGRMPIELVRARLRGEAPQREFRSSWRFADEL